MSSSWVKIRLHIENQLPRLPITALIVISPTALLQSKGMWARDKDTSKNWRGFVDKNKARVAPGSGLLYIGGVYIGTDDLDTIC
jgi:hypothetical protein